MIDIEKRRAYGTRERGIINSCSWNYLGPSYPFARGKNDHEHVIQKAPWAGGARKTRAELAAGKIQRKRDASKEKGELAAGKEQREREERRKKYIQPHTYAD